MHLTCTGYGRGIQMDLTGAAIRVWGRTIFIDALIEKGFRKRSFLKQEGEAVQEAIRFRREVLANRLVYFVQAASDGPIKIGVAIDVDRRLREIQTGSPFRLRVLAVVLGGYAEESRLHKHFATDRLEGEWFAPSERLLAHIATLPRFEALS